MKNIISIILIGASFIISMISEAASNSIQGTVPPTGLTFSASVNGAPPMAISPNPLTITQNGVTTTYNMWFVSSVVAQGQGSGIGMSVPLTVTFQLINSSGQVAPIAAKTYTIPNILNDGNLNTGIALFFRQLSTEAFQNGAIK